MQPDIRLLLSQAMRATRRSEELVSESMELIEQFAKIRARAMRQAAETQAVLRGSAQRQSTHDNIGPAGAHESRA
jgi:hypothetical protein